MARYRDFKPERDATELLQRAGVLQGDERILWVSDAGIRQYAVHGREESGRRKSPWDFLELFEVLLCQ